MPVYHGSFTWQKSDGSSEKITVPGRYSVSPEDTMVITSTLPEDYDSNTLSVRSSLQSIRFYINGKLRSEYDTKDTRLAGKNSASRYVFCKTSDADAGKELSIELRTNTKQYSGVVNTVYCGDKTDIWEFLFTQYGMETIIAFFLLFASVITIIFSIMLGLIYHTKFDMEYLGWCMLMGSIWMLGESKFRQLLVPHSSALATLCFIILMLSPLPVLFYADQVQHRKYRRLYLPIGWLAIFNFIISTILHLPGILDYIETLFVSHAILLLTVFAVLFTFALDIKKDKKRRNLLAFIGLLAATVSVMIEGISTYFVVSLSGIFVGIGMIILFSLNVLRTAGNIHMMELRRQKKELAKRKRQLEKVSLQMIQTLSTTIEAKDEYARGHSHRVAEYAALIAGELGWSSEEIMNLKYAAHLHDIGKIGIPDMLLNKPARLTPEEYSVIKEHTVIGAEILKNISLIPHVAEVARSHHEHYDGTGYPDGLAGEDIPLSARIVAIADSYDAMNSRRIYRNALPPEKIFEEIENNRGIQFDPELADIFLKLLCDDRVQICEHCEFSEDDPELPFIENEIENFVSNVMSKLQTQEDSESFDFLTGLPMRSRGEKLTAQFMQQYSGCLIFIDMDNLKKINDIHGHKAGDRALKVLGTLLTEVSPNSIVCRLGGDEFLLFIPETDKEQVTAFIQNLFEKFEHATSEDPEIQYASISAGLYLSAKGEPFEDCYSKADKALYHVKQNGKQGFFFYQQMELDLSENEVTGKDLGLIAHALSESGRYNGALNLDYREFAKIYEYMNHLNERYKHHCFLIMVTIDTAPGSVTHTENREQALACMEQAIHEKIRRVDICTRYSSMQYLLILYEPDETQISKVMDRIFQYYDTLYDKKDFIPSYEYRPIQHSND
jgi:diguanylate cyclase (GGDEF)-like protein/putative nucleotidyltransferase with HDIG domain